MKFSTAHLLYLPPVGNLRVKDNSLFQQLVYTHSKYIEQVVVHIMQKPKRLVHHLVLQDAKSQIYAILTSTKIENLTQPLDHYFFTPVQPTASDNVIFLKNQVGLDLSKIRLLYEVRMLQAYSQHREILKQILIEKPFAFSAKLQSIHVPKLPPFNKVANKINLATTVVGIHRHYAKPLNVYAPDILCEQAELLLPRLKTYDENFMIDDLFNYGHTHKLYAYLAQEHKTTALMQGLTVISTPDVDDLDINPE